MSAKSMQIEPDEKVLIGGWEMNDGRMIADNVTERIVRLTTGYLSKVGTDSSGWETLYRDPADGRFWELIYPRGEMHGGGPPQLQHLDEDATDKKYGIKLK